MPTRKNPYRDPAIAQAFNNIAAMFAPPSGSDAQGFAVANAQRAEAERKAQIYANPDSAQAAELAARLGYANYGQTQPGFAQTDLTNRRAQDVDASTRLRSTQMNNDTVLATNKLDNTTKSITSLFGARDPYQVQPAVPAEVAGLVGLPAVPEMRGAPKPMSETEVKGAERQDLRNRGVLTDDNLKDIIMGQQAPVTVQGADGRTVYTTPGNAALKQLPAAAAPTAGDGKLVEGTAVINGQPAQVFRTPASRNYVQADGTPLPSGTQVFEMAKPQASQNDLKVTEFQDRNAIFYNRGAKASASMDNLTAQGYMPSGKDYELIFGGIGEKLPITLSNALVSDAGRNYYNSAMDFMLSVLRPDTGAAFGPSEFQSYGRVFIPLPSDDPTTIARKKDARETALAALQGTSKGAADRITQLMSAQGLAVPPEMARRMAISQQLAAQPQKGASPQGVKSAPSANSGGLLIVNTPEEARALPSGTRFKTPDGVERVRP